MPNQRNADSGTVLAVSEIEMCRLSLHRAKRSRFSCSRYEVHSLPPKLQVPFLRGMWCVSFLYTFDQFSVRFRIESDPPAEQYVYIYQ